MSYFSKENEPVSKDLERDFYNPNFVLVGDSVQDFKFVFKNTFGDIIPIYSSFFKLTTVINSSVEGSFRQVNSSFSLLANIAVYIISLIVEIVNSSIYNIYLFLEESLENIQAIPGKFLAIQTNLNKLQTVIKNAKVRHFWWLNLKLELKQQITKIYNQLELAFGVLKKLYLLVLIVVSFSSLAFIGNANFVNSSASFSAKVISNYTKPETVKYNITSTIGLTPINQLKQQGTSDNLFLSRVSEYKVESGDTLDKIAEMHGISVEAITFNNQIKAEDATLPTTLYLPFSDSYIYKATKDTKIDDLARIYGLSKQAIYSVNETTLNQETQSFPTGSLVVIPISNFNEVAQKNSTESARISDEENKSKAYTYNTATTTVNSTKYAESTSDQRSAGLIFPTVWGGTITSRCIQPGHIACDFANRSEPPIFAAQNGKVVTKAYEAYGYGNYVVIDHGNGIKTLYAHMQAVYVTLGQDVTQGQSIGQMGCVGACTGTHVHFEVILNGVKQNPVNYLEKIP